MLRRNTPLRATKPLKRTLATRRQRDTGPDRNTVEAVYERAGWCCERCFEPVEPVRGVGHHIHHRRPRAAGGSRRPDTNRPSNLVLLCPPCHGEVESRRAEALSEGWLLPQTAAPAACAVLARRGSQWVYLTDSAAYSTGPPDPEVSHG